jgi:hypothetical protein
MAGDPQWERDLYRHPQRQGLWPEEEYGMLHDVYSLGVVLLEIGLWTNFIVYSPSKEVSVGTEISTAINNLQQDYRKGAVLNKKYFVELAQEKLPCTMGTKYADVVVSCLTCLDTVDPGLGDPDEFLDKDDIVVGVEFIESVSSFMSNPC